MVPKILSNEESRPSPVNCSGIYMKPLLKNIREPNLIKMEKEN